MGRVSLPAQQKEKLPSVKTGKEIQNIWRKRACVLQGRVAGVEQDERKPNGWTVEASGQLVCLA